MVMTGAKKSDTINVSYVSYRVGGVIAESRFLLPKGIEIRPMPEAKKPEETQKADGQPVPEKSEPKPAESADAK
jgi:hypothetical protein